MKKLTIISTGLLFGSFVFLTGSPMVDKGGVTVALAQPPACKQAPHIKIGTLTGAAKNELGRIGTPSAGAPAGPQAVVVFVLTNEGKILLFDTPGNSVSNDNVDPSNTVVNMNLGTTASPNWVKVNTITTVVPTSGPDPCVTINGRDYCW